MTPVELDLLWKRVEDARLKWKSAHQRVKAVHEDSASIPPADGSYADVHSLQAQLVAVENYLHALQEFKAELAGAAESGPLEEEKAGSSSKHTNGHESITPREREVLALIAAGKSSKQIAAQLGIAFRTAVCHRYHLYRKLGVHTNVELTRAAMRMGLIEL